jgi:glycosyltransferase involved in cell wall biosynthesis
VDLVLLQHEFGLFGKLENGAVEDHTRVLLDAIDRPIITTLHTVPQRPSPAVRAVLRRLCERGAAIVVLARSAVRILVDDYGVDPARLTVIPHGVPTVRPEDTERLKRALRLSGCTVLSTFGLLHRRKGIELAIRALPAIVARHPEVRYLVLGQTHPTDQRQEGESYRRELAALARRLGVGRHVRFIGHYLKQQSLLHYLQATDVYLTPYHDPSQISSGTLSYALGLGRAIVSTPYVYAREALAEGRGALVDFGSHDQIAAAVLRFLDDPAHRAATQARALAYGRAMAWPQVGWRYLALFERVLGAGPHPQPLSREGRGAGARGARGAGERVGIVAGARGNRGAGERAEQRAAEHRAGERLHRDVATAIRDAEERLEPPILPGPPQAPSARPRA